MNPCKSLVVLALLGACTTPDTTPDLTEARRLLTGLRTELDAGLAATANQERIDAEDRLIRAGEAVIDAQGSCDTVAARTTEAVLSRCVLVSHAQPAEGVTNATATLRMLALFDDYLASLEALASAQTAAQARQQAQALVDAFGAPNEARPAAFEALGAQARANKALIVEGSTFLLDQVRLASLRRVIQRGQPEVMEGVRRATAYLELRDDRLLHAQEELNAALRDMQLALDTGDRARHRAAIRTVRTRHAAFVATEAAAPEIRLRLFARAHARLAQVVQRPGTLTEIVTLLEQLRGLHDAAAQGDQP